MLKLFKAEIIYSRKLLFTSALLILLICLYEVAISEFRIGYTLLVMYLVTALYNTTRNKENRKYLEARLPVSMRQMAIRRILMVFLFCVCVSCLYFVLYYLFHFESSAQTKKLIVYSYMILLCFSIYLIFIDLRALSFRSRGFSIKKALGLTAVFGLNFVVIYLFVQYKLTHEVSPVLYYLDKINIIFDPPANNSQLWLFLLICCGVGALSVYTFEKRNSYL